jgi:dephospho-CoA kinase
VRTIGLTGGIGSGKSTVSALLTAKGAVVIDADAITKELQQPGTEVFAKMVERFGPGIVAADGTLDRPAVAEIVFNDPEALQDLNAIVHPAVGAETTRRILEQADTDNLVVLDIPLLVENAGKREVAGIVVVDVDPEVALRRLVEHRGMAEEDARARMARQATREERLARADLVIDNSGTPEDLARLVDELWPQIEALGVGPEEAVADVEQATDPAEDALDEASER